MDKAPTIEPTIEAVRIPRVLITASNVSNVNHATASK